jgi:hypothetical protein
MKNVHLIPTEKPSRLGYLTKKGKEVFKDLRLFEKPMPIILDSENQNIYITSDEEIKEGNWMYYKHFGEDIVCKYNTMNSQNTNVNEHKPFYQKIILTTDQDLIKDGVQAINDEFLKWFVKNPSCERIEVEEVYPLNCCIQKEGKTKMNNGCMERNRCLNYKIIIPREEPTTFLSFDKEVADTITREGQALIRELQKHVEQETLEEAAESYYTYNIFCDGITEFEHGIAIRSYIAGAKCQAERRYSEEEVIILLQKYRLDLSSGKTPILGDTTKFWFEQYKK